MWLSKHKLIFIVLAAVLSCVLLTSCSDSKGCEIVFYEHANSVIPTSVYFDIEAVLSEYCGDGYLLTRLVADLFDVTWRDDTRGAGFPLLYVVVKDGPESILRAGSVRLDMPDDMVRMYYVYEGSYVLMSNGDGTGREYDIYAMRDMEDSERLQAMSDINDNLIDFLHQTVR